MGKLGGGGLILGGLLSIFVGAVLRWDFLKDVIDFIGILFFLLGAGLGIAGIVKVFSGGGEKGSSGY